MQEFWFCASCQSMNRADAARCYKCRAPKEQATLATVQERHLEGVLMPGSDRLAPQVAGAMAQAPYVPAWPLGWLSAFLLFVTAFFAVGFIVADVAISISQLSGADESRTPLSGLLVVGVLGAGICWLLSAAAHSVYLGLVDMNVPSLGGGQPRFQPWRAAGWWIESTLWFIGAMLLVYGPLRLCEWIMSDFSFILGLALLVPLYGAAYALLGNPMRALRKPARLLEDLLKRLSMSGSGDAGLASMWSAAWVAARLILLLFPFLALGVFLVAGVVLVARVQPDVASFVDPFKLGKLMFATILLLGIAIFVAETIALFLLARITISLSSSERSRRRWVLSNAAVGPATGPWPVPAIAPMPVAPPRPEASSAVQPGPTSPSAVAPSAGYVADPPAQPPGQTVVWSRTVERAVREPNAEAIPPEALPVAWRDAIQRTPAPGLRPEADHTGQLPVAPAPGLRPQADQTGQLPVAPAPVDPDVEVAAPIQRRVIQPSPFSLSRYRPAVEPVEPDRPDADTANDVDIGGGI